MDILAIGDVHGRDAWKDIEGTQADHIIFIGDYVDPHLYIPDAEVILNFEEIIDLKMQNPDRVSLLLGNHDIQYMYYPDHQCSGHRTDLQSILGDLYKKNTELFQIAWQCEGHLFTHAGVSRTWFTRHLATLAQYEQNSLAATLNAIHQSEDRKVLFEVGYSRGGKYPSGGPVWADKAETEHDFLAGYHQVVGHSRVPDFVRYGNTKSSITYIDVQDTQVKFYEVSILN
jgi:hypothetical protein